MNQLLKISFFLALNLLCILPLFAEALDKSALSELESKVREFTLENGLRVVMYRRGIAPVFSGDVSVRVGGVDEKVGHTGISHLLEHMAFKGTSLVGTSNYRRERKLLDQIEQILGDNHQLTDQEQQDLQKLRQELEAIWIPGELSREYSKRGVTGLNATTAKELTKYFANFPSSALEFWCWMESERFLDPVMRQFYKERDVVKEERRMRYSDSPEGELYEQLLGVAYLAHPYRYPVIGYEFDLDRLNAQETLRFMRKHYVPGNMVVSLVGDLNPDEDIKIVEKYFGRLKAAPVPQAPGIVEPEQRGEREIVVRRQASPQLFVAYKKPVYPDADDAPISVGLEILAGGKTSPFYTELVERKQFAADIGYTEAPGNMYPNLALFIATPRAPHSNQQLLKTMDGLLESFIQEGPSQEQLERARRSMAMEYLTGLRSNSSLARNFGSSTLLYGSWKSIIDWFDQIMRVQKEDVQRVMKKYFQVKYRTIGRVEQES